MNLVDIIIIVGLLVSLVSGFRRGLVLALMQYAGMIGGVVAGAYFAPDVLRATGLTDTLLRQGVALLVVVLAAGIGGSIGFWLGGPVRRWLASLPVIGALDSLAGAAFSVALTLVVVWLLAFALARGPVPDLARQIQRSEIVARIDAVAPEPPAFIAKAQQALSGTFLPPVFVGLEPELPRPVTPAAESASTPGVQTASASTVKVAGLGCGGVPTGSGFAVQPGVFVTNAHVVAGAGRITVSGPDGRSRPATVALFDPELDIAVLRAPDLALTPLAPADAAPGTRGAAIGYPGGGPLNVSPAVVQRRITARGRDIYNEQIVTREIWSVSAAVRPGNSGGPLVDENGRYIGVIFAGSTTNSGQAFALTGPEVAERIREGAAARDTIDTRRLRCSA